MISYLIPIIRRRQLFSAAGCLADLRATARRQRVDYLLLWRVPADFVARYGKDLGLHEGEEFPLLLRLDAWREGERELPEKIVLPVELGRQ